MKDDKSYTDTLWLIGLLGEENAVRLVGSLDLDETVGGVADATRENLVAQHRVYHRTLPVRRSESKVKSEAFGIYFIFYA